MADLMSLYRFINNDQAPLAALRSIRAQAVLEGVAAGAPLAIIHDVTQLDYTRHNGKQDRRDIGNGGGKGYEYVPCVAVDPENGSLLGVLHDTVISADGPDDPDQVDYHDDPLFSHFSQSERKRLRENHRHQMAVHIQALKPLLGNRQAIHLGDREFDDIFILDRCRQTGCDFVIRSSGHRNVQVPDLPWVPQSARTRKQAGHRLDPGWIYASLAGLIAAVALQPYKSLPLDSRNRVVDARNSTRIAHLSIGTFPVRLYRFAMRNKQYLKPPRTVEVNVVVIREVNPPAGLEPLCWVLLTSLPVDDFAQQAWVGHLYELRWRIEDFFKLLKCGYAVESSRLENAEKTAKLLLLLSLAAMVVTNMKTHLGLRMQGRLSDTDYRRVKTAIQQLDNPNLDLELRLFALILKFGGWLRRRNDPIGPTVLMRGLLQLLATFNVVEEHSRLLKEAQLHPEILRKLFAYKC
jgi:hypothetical protein